MSIDREQVKKVAHLARLEITPEEEEQFYHQLSSILEYFDQLSELDTDNVAPTTRAMRIKKKERKFEDKEAFLAAAPEQEGSYFKVPKILADNEG